MDQRDDKIESLSVQLTAALANIAKLGRSNESLAAERDRYAHRALSAEQRADELHDHVGELRELETSDAAKLIAERDEARRHVQVEISGRMKIESALCDAMGSWQGAFLEAAVSLIKRAGELDRQNGELRVELASACCKRALASGGERIEQPVLTAEPEAT